MPYEWTIWLGGLALHLPQFLVWLGLQLLRHGLMYEYFMEQDNGADNHRIFAVTVQDPESTAIWNIVRVDSNNTEAFKQMLQQLKEVGVHLRAITSDGWPAIPSTSSGQACALFVKNCRMPFICSATFTPR